MKPNERRRLRSAANVHSDNWLVIALCIFCIVAWAAAIWDALS